MRFESEMASRISAISQENEQLRSRVTVVAQENEQLRRRVGELQPLTAQYEERVNMLSTEVERLNGVLRTKLAELRDVEARWQKAAADADEMRGKLNEWAQKFDRELKARTESIEQRVKLLERENDELRRRVQEYESNISILRQEIERLNVVLKQRVDVEARSTTLVQEIERLNNVLRIKVQESQEWEIKYSSLFANFREV